MNKKKKSCSVSSDLTGDGHHSISDILVMVDKILNPGTLVKSCICEDRKAQVRGSWNLVASSISKSEDCSQAGDRSVSEEGQVIYNFSYESYTISLMGLDMETFGADFSSYTDQVGGQINFVGGGHFRIADLTRDSMILHLPRHSLNSDIAPVCEILEFSKPKGNDISGQ